MKTYTLELTGPDIALIGSLFDEQPYKLVAPLIQRMQAQINRQDTEPPAPQTPAVDPASEA